MVFHFPDFPQLNLSEKKIETKFNPPAMYQKYEVYGAVYIFNIPPKIQSRVTKFSNQLELIPPLPLKLLLISCEGVRRAEIAVCGRFF